ncbi:MAG: lysylphosphatidylglycerol synthase transmembrane domain-containing protein [Thermoleophilaceae bacterium]
MTAGVLAKRGLLLAVTAVSLYLLAPALLEVFGAYERLDEFNPLWWIAMVLLQVGSYACMWELQRISMRARRHGPVVTSQLASNAFGRVVPGGVAAAGAMQYAMLTRAGVPGGRAASGMTASSVLVFGILLALPLLALPAVLFGAPVDPGLGKAALIGGVMFVLLFAAGAAAIQWDRPLVLVGRAAQSLRNRIRRRRAPLTGLPDRLLRERNSVTMVLGQRWWQALLLAVGRWLLDYLTLLAALTAVHADPRPSTVLLAFCAAQFLGTLPLTPGGLGFVEAGLTGTLALAGVPAGAAVVATLAYRLVSFWLPIPAGGVAAILHRRHYGVEDEPAAAAAGRTGP